MLRQLAPDSLLDAYQDERMPSARQAIEFSMELGRVICAPDPAEAAMRDEAMAAMVTDEPTAVPDLPGPTEGVVHPDAPHAGHLFVQGEVDGQPFDEVHGAGWRLVTIADRAAVETLQPDDAAWFATLGGVVVVLGGDAPTHTRWFADHQASWALVRPDFRLDGAAATVDDAARLLGDLRRRLTAPTLEGTPA